MIVGVDPARCGPSTRDRTASALDLPKLCVYRDPGTRSRLVQHHVSGIVRHRIPHRLRKIQLPTDRSIAGIGSDESVLGDRDDQASGNQRSMPARVPVGNPLRAMASEPLEAGESLE